MLAIAGGLAYCYETGRWPFRPKPKRATVSLDPSLTIRYPDRTEIIEQPEKLGEVKGLAYVIDNNIREIDFGWDIHVVVTRNGEPIVTPMDLDIDASVVSDGVNIGWSEPEFPYNPGKYRGKAIIEEGPWIPPGVPPDWPPTPPENFWSCKWYHVAIPITDDDIVRVLGSGKHKIKAGIEVKAETTALPIKVEASNSGSMTKDIEVTRYGMTVEVSPYR